MSRNYYILSNGRVQREDNTLSIVNANGSKRPIPVEDVESIYLYGEVDINTKLLNFLSKKRIPLHVFNYYGFYSGSYYPREYLNSGHLLVKQVLRYADATGRMALANEFVAGAAHSITRTLAYYSRRKGPSIADDEPAGEVGGQQAAAPTIAFPPISEDAQTATKMETLEIAVDSALSCTTLMEGLDPLSCTADLYSPNESNDGNELASALASIANLTALVGSVSDVNILRGIEGKIRETYYQCWKHILPQWFEFNKRIRRPPDNEINSLISFGNSMLYTVCLGEIYRTQLSPTIAYLHEPGARRFSLALDLSEVFKPLIVDRTIFRLVNTGQLKPEHFDKSLDGCFLSEDGRKLFLTAFEEKLGSTIRHRQLGRHVSYRHLIRLECYRLIRDLTGIETYRAFRAWW